MVTKMKKYVIPPTFDFITNPEKVDPMTMLIFEFETKLSQKDLTNMWQNLPPNDTDAGKVSISQAVLPAESMGTFPLLKKGEGLDIFEVGAEVPHGDLFGDWDPEDGFPTDIQWIVFKVKQKAQTKYVDLTAKGELMESALSALAKAISGDKDMKVPPIPSTIPDYSYNWPYDFFSMVELVRLESTYKIEPASFIPPGSAADAAPDSADPDYGFAVDDTDSDQPSGESDPDKNGPTQEDLDKDVKPAPDDDPVDWPPPASGRAGGGRAGGGRADSGDRYGGGS
jgi:hypothetical protein